MPSWLKKTLGWLLAIFVVYYIITKPEEAAAFALSIWDALGAIPRFFGALVNG